MRHLRSIQFTLAAVVGMQCFGLRSGNAAVLMDQIGSNPSYFTGQTAELSQQITDPGYSTYSAATVDDFTTTGGATLTNVSTAVLGFGDFTSFTGVTGWEVAIYSSLSAASTNLTGDVYDHTFAPSAVTVTTPFSGDATSALVSIPTNISVPTAGTYYVAVMAQNSFFSNGEVGVFETSGPTGATPGGLNSYLADPSGLYSSTAVPLDDNAAYAITAVVPEPASLLVLGFAGIAISCRRRRPTTGQ